METLHARTQVRKDNVKRLLREIILEERDQWITVKELLVKLKDGETEYEFNRTIVEHHLGELMKEGQVHCGGGKVYWTHRRPLCHQDDGAGRCQCCNSPLLVELGGRRCEHC